MAFQYTSSIVGLLAVVALANCDRGRCDEVAAPAGMAPAIADGSPHFARVMKRLDVGGKMLQFEDHEGRREMFVELANGLLEAVPKDLVKGPIDAAGLVDACGLGEAAASGKSLRKDGESWLLRRYTYLPAKRHGFAELLGAEAVAFRSPELLPATTDFVIEACLDATTLPALMQRIAKACGQETEVQGFLNEPLPAGAPLQAALAKTRLHIILGLDISAWQAVSPTPQPIDFFLQIEGGQELWKSLQPELEKELGQPRDFGTKRGWELPIEGKFFHPQALLLFDKQGTVTCVSRQQYLQRIESNSSKLAAAKEFMTATDHFPKDGNLLVYASSRIPTAVAWAIRHAAPNLDADAEPVIVTVAKFLKARPWSLCVACEPDGIATTSELPFAADTSLTGVVPLLSINSILFVGARAWKKGSDRAGCMLNVRNVQQAVRSYQNMNTIEIGAPIPWDKLFGKDGFLTTKPTCPAGGTYTYLTKFPQVGELICKCSDPDHEPAQHADW